MNASDVTAYVLKYKIMLQLKGKSSQTCGVSVIRVMYVCPQVSTLIV